MLRERQRRFAESTFSPERHQSMLALLHRELDVSIEFRVMESPAFCSIELRDRIASAARELVMMCSTPAYRLASQSALRSELSVPHEPARPLFSVVDFAVSIVNGEAIPKLVELQGFPSLFGYQLFLADAFNSVYNIDKNFSPFFQSMSRNEYVDLLRTAIVADHHPDNVALLELDPEHQKTLPDFRATKALWGVDATDIRSVVVSDSQLFHERARAVVPIRRVYNRAIVDELEESGTVVPFNWTDELKVEWAGHPNWYFRMSKYSLPFLKHPNVPDTTFISELRQIPADLSHYVLKPLYAFAGKGVNVHPTAADIESIPEEQRPLWVLMEKIDYADCLYTPLGDNKIEIRCMMVWLPDAPEPVPTINLVRSGRGSMMGARFNTVEWSGASIAFFGEE